MDSSRSAVRKLSDVGRAGRLDLTFALQSGRTVIRDCYCEIPYKITRLYHPETSSLAQLIVMNGTAGLFPGDHAEIDIRVESGARILITSQASTKVHPGFGIAEQSLRACVDSGGELHVYNDPLIPFRGARMRQRVELNVAPDARLYYWDGLSAGRVSRREVWEFDEIDTETHLIRSGKIVYLERYRLHPASGSPARPWIMHGNHYVGTGLVCDRVNLSSAFSPSVGIDEPCPGVTVIRAVARTGTEFRNIQRDTIAGIFRERGEPPPDLRKY